MALGQRREVSTPRPRTVPPLRHYPRLLSRRRRRFDCGVAAPFPALDPRRANRSQYARPHGPVDSPAPIPPAPCRPKSRFFAPSSHLFSITVCDYTVHSTRPCAASVLSSKTSTWRRLLHPHPSSAWRLANLPLESPWSPPSAPPASSMG